MRDANATVTGSFSPWWTRYPRSVGSAGAEGRGGSSVTKEVSRHGRGSFPLEGDAPIRGLEGLERGEGEALPLPILGELHQHPVAAARRFIEQLHQRGEGGRVHVV